MWTATVLSLRCERPSRQAMFGESAARPCVASTAANLGTRPWNADRKPVINSRGMRLRAKKKERIKEQILRKDEAATSDLDEDEKFRHMLLRPKCVCGSAAC